LVNAPEGNFLTSYRQTSSNFCTDLLFSNNFGGSLIPGEHVELKTTQVPNSSIDSNIMPYKHVQQNVQITGGKFL
jgi:hypothetical protein